MKRHYRKDYNPHPHNDIKYKKGVIRVLRHAEPPAGDPNPQARLGAGRYPLLNVVGYKVWIFFSKNKKWGEYKRTQQVQPHPRRGYKQNIMLRINQG